MLIAARQAPCDNPISGRDTAQLLTAAIGASHAGAKKLAARGAVLVTGDAAKQADLRGAFKGAWGVFAMISLQMVTDDFEAATEAEFALGALSHTAQAVR